MAKVVLHPMTRTIHGRLGNIVFRRTPSGGVSAIKLADMSNVQWSPAQKAHRKQFKEAIRYARSAMAEPTVRLIYERGPGNKINVRFTWLSLIISRERIC